MFNLIIKKLFVIGIVCILNGIYFNSIIQVESKINQTDNINDIKTANTITIHPTHPRIFFTQNDLPSLQQRINTSHSNQWQEFINYLNEWLDYNYTDVPEWYLDVDVKAFAFGYIMTSNADYLSKAIELMNIMINWEIPNDDMPNRERLLTLAIGYDWTYNGLSPLLRTAISSRINDYMLWVSDFFDGSNNWFQGHVRWGMITLCIGALSTYYEVEEAPLFLNESSDPIINHIVPIWEFFGAEDGGHYYGTDYEGIVLRDMMYFFEAWQSTTGEDLINNSQFWPKCVDYRIALTHPDMSQERVDDCWAAKVASYEKVVADWIASKYDVGPAQWFAEQINESDPDGYGVDRWELWSEILWYESTIESILPNWTSKHFKGIGQVSMRSGWNQNDTIVTFFCGDYGGGHDHYHQNSFTIFTEEEILIHNGAYDSFGSSHHNGYYQRTISSNTITVFDPNEDFSGEINDGGQRFIRKEFGDPLNIEQYQENIEQYDCGDILHFYSNSDIDYVMGDATKAYRDSKIQDFTRQLVFLKPSTIIIYDRLAITNPNYEINWHLNSMNPPEINETIATISNNHTIISCQTLLPHNAHVNSSAVFDVYGITIPPDDNWTGSLELGEGRLDVSPTVSGNKHQFLHLLSIGNTTRPSTSNGQLIESIEENASGIQANNHTILFANNDTKNDNYLKKISFIAKEQASKQYVFDVEPNASYNLFIDNIWMQKKNASSEGFLFFNQTIQVDDVVRIQLSFLPLAIINHEPLIPMINQTVYFNSTSFDTDGFIVNWTWSIQDTIMIYGKNIEYIFLENGNYFINLTVIDNDANRDFSSIMIQVGPFEILHINQSIFNRGFPIRHAADGDWAAAQSFTHTLNTLSKCEIYMRKFGNPEFNLTVNLRKDHPQGLILDTLFFTPEEIVSSWQWLELDFNNVPITPSTEYFIVCPPAPSGVTTSFGYEWGYAFGNQYDGGSFWFTRDGGSLWRDLPTSFEFVFRTYGYD